VNAGRQVSLSARLARLGFQDPARAELLLADPALAGLIDPLDVMFEDGLLSAVGETPDPDLALLALVRLMESLHRLTTRDPDDPSIAAADVAHLLQAIRVGGPVRDRLLAVLGSSTALGDHLVRHPEHWIALSDDLEEAAPTVREALLRAVGADSADDQPTASCGGTVAYDRLRVAYRGQLLALAARDLADDDPTSRRPPGPSFSWRSASRDGSCSSTRRRIACTSSTKCSRSAARQTKGATASTYASPRVRSPATGRAFSSAWNSHVFAHRS
jgi:glutamate-ammonia-ligase adenylyltransferase